MPNSPDPIEAALSSLARESPPAASPALAAEVWRTIRGRRARPFWSRLLPILDWRDLFAEPRLVASALAVSLGVGILPAVLSVRPPSSDWARASLHFEVFSPANPTLLEPGNSAPSAGAAPARP
jgi:hypothetical protein